MSSFYTCTKNHDYMMYGLQDTECDTKCFVILCHILDFHPTNNPKKS